MNEKRNRQGSPSGATAAGISFDSRKTDTVPPSVSSPADFVKPAQGILIRGMLHRCLLSCESFERPGWLSSLDPLVDRCLLAPMPWPADDTPSRGTPWRLHWALPQQLPTPLVVGSGQQLCQSPQAIDSVCTQVKTDDAATILKERVLIAQRLGRLE